MNRYDRPRDPREPKKKDRHVVWVVVALVVAAVAVVRISDRPSAQPPRAVRPLASLRAKDLQEQAVEQAILGGARAGKEAIVAQRAAALNAQIGLTDAGDTLAPEPRLEKTDRGYRVLGAWSEKPYVLPRDEEEAKADALAVARARLAQELRGLTPALEVIGEPRTVEPSAEAKEKLAKQGLESGRRWVVVDVQTSDEAIRAERGKQRFGSIALWVGVAFLTLLTGYGFLRLDMWTKGYLTTSLVVLAVLVLGGLLLGYVSLAH